jgi:predicted nucleic acid-binding Zn ribbon protein
MTSIVGHRGPAPLCSSALDPDSPSILNSQGVTVSRMLVGRGGPHDGRGQQKPASVSAVGGRHPRPRPGNANHGSVSLAMSTPGSSRAAGPSPERSAPVGSPELACIVCGGPRDPRKREACSDKRRTALSRRRRTQAQTTCDRAIRATLEANRSARAGHARTARAGGLAMRPRVPSLWSFGGAVFPPRADSRTRHAIARDHDRRGRVGGVSPTRPHAASTASAARPS